LGRLRQSLGRDPSTLNDEQRRLVAVCDLRQEVNSGGFDSYFRYRGGNSALDAARSLPSLPGQDWADLLKEAMDLLGPEYPIDQADRESLMDARDLDEQFERLDTRYYALRAARTLTRDSTNTFPTPRRRWPERGARTCRDPRLGITTHVVLG
jgi:hypothetical protein